MESKPPSGIAQLAQTFGFRAQVNGGVQFIDDQVVAYICGATIVIYNIETKTQRFIPLHEKSIQTRVFKISPNHRFIAAAEVFTEKPVICIYDSQALRRKKTLQIPDSQMTEIVSLDFSSDSKYLAVLSSSPEFMLYYYSWEKGKLLASMRTNSNPTSDTTQVSFNPKDPTQICVTGKEFFKVYRYQEGTLKSSVPVKVDLHDYTCHAWTNEEGIIAGTSTGIWVLVENYECKVECNLAQLVQKEVEHADPKHKYYIGTEDKCVLQSIQACLAYGRMFIFSCGPGMLHFYERIDKKDSSKSSYTIKRVKELRIPPEKMFALCGIPTCDDIILNICVNPAEESLVCSTASNQIMVYAITSDLATQNKYSMKELGKETLPDEPQVELTYLNRLTQPFHYGELIGLDVCARKPIILTSASDRTIRVWNYDKNILELYKEFAEEAYAVALHPSGLYCAVGFNDKLRLMNLLIDDIRPFKELPIRGCRECAFSNGGHLLAAAHGNSIQIYSTVTFQTLPSLKGHNGKIRSLIWTSDDSKIISCGMDGAIYEWEPHSGKRIHENVLKACSYTSLTTAPDNKTIYAVGTDFKLKEVSESMIVKETVVSGPLMTAICMSQSGRMLFAGLDNGMLRSFAMPLTIPPDYTDFVGHDKAIVKMSVAGHDEYLITISEDACVIIWKIHDREGRGPRMDRDFVYAEEILITRSDLEEKNTTMQELKTRIDELKMENEYQLRIKEMNHNERLKELTEKFIQEMETLKTRNQVLRTEKDKEEMKHEDRMQETLEKHNRDIEDMEANANQKLMIEYEKLQEVQSNAQKMQENYEARIEELQDLRQKDVNELTQYFENKISEHSETIESLNRELREQNMEGEITKRLIEEDTDREILEIKIKYETQLKEEKDKNSKLRGESGILKKKFITLQKEIDEQKEDLKKAFLETNKLNSIIKNLEQDITGFKKEIAERDETIQDKERRIYELKKKNQELEKFKFVLDYKIKELKKQIEPREQDIKNYRDQIQEMEAELERFHKQNVQLELSVQEVKQKKRAVDDDLAMEKQITRDVEASLRRLKTDVYNCVGCIQEPKLLKSAMIALYKKHIQSDKGSESVGDADIQKEFSRQREHLERSVAGLKKKLTKDSEMHRQDYVRIMQQNVLLITEINDLRTELKGSRIRVSNLEATLGLNRKDSEPIRQKFAEVSRSKPNPILELELEEANKMLKMQQDMILVLHDQINGCKNNSNLASNKPLPPISPDNTKIE